MKETLKVKIFYCHHTDQHRIGLHVESNYLSNGFGAKVQ